MKKVLFTSLAVLALASPAFAANPTLAWDYQTSEVSNVTGWTYTVDGGVAQTATPTSTANGATTTFTFQLPSQPSPATHTFVVYACNPLVCTASDPYTIKPPVKAPNVRLQ